MGHRRRWVLLSALLAVVAGCDPLPPPEPSQWTPPSVTWTWPTSQRDLTYYLPGDAALAGVGLTLAGPPVANPRIELLRVCDFTQPWDGLVKQGLEVTWHTGRTGHDIRQYITRYDHVAGKDVLAAIRQALNSCGRFPLDGKTFHEAGVGVGFSGADAADAHEIFCAEAGPDGPTRCFLLLASADRLTELIMPGDNDRTAQIDYLVSAALPFTLAMIR